jgi:hypothetical protein
MLRMVLLGLLIPLGVGVLSAMELRTPPRNAVATVQPLAETTVAIADSRGALPKADRLEIAAEYNEAPTQPALVDEPVAPSEGVSIAPSEPLRPVNRHRHVLKSKKVIAAARLKPKPKATDIKRATIAQRSRPAGNAEPCRLEAFGGLRKALNSADCEI